MGIGLALAAGIRPFAAFGVAAVMARLGAGMDVSGTDLWFLGSWIAVAAGFGLAVAFVVAEQALGRRGGKSPSMAPGLMFVGIAAGALLFAGSLAPEGRIALVGLAAGAIVAAAARWVVGSVVSGAAKRLSDEDSTLLIVLVAEAVAVIFAAGASLLPPLSYVWLILVFALAVGRRRQKDRKYEGLRVLR